MEVFVATRAPAEVAKLMAQLRHLGISGRDAAYLASREPPGTADPVARKSFIAEFKYMVPPPSRDEAARLLGIVEA